jgi:hypothetical protein
MTLKDFIQKFNHYSNVSIGLAVLGTIVTVITLRATQPKLEADLAPSVTIFSIESPDLVTPGATVDLALNSNSPINSVTWTIDQLPNMTAGGQFASLNIPDTITDDRLTIRAHITLGDGRQSIQKTRELEVIRPGS